jgi:hypothetical protein
MGGSVFGLFCFREAHGHQMGVALQWIEGVSLNVQAILTPFCAVRKAVSFVYPCWLASCDVRTSCSELTCL